MYIHILQHAMLYIHTSTVVGTGPKVTGEDEANLLSPSGDVLVSPLTLAT